MNYSHVVVWIDHQDAHLVRFNADSHASENIRAYEGKEHLHHHAGTLGSGRAKVHPDYFPKVALALGSAQEVLVVGPGIAKTEFVHYLEAYQPALRAKVLGVESSDRISDGQLLAMAKKWFGPADQLRGTTLR